jgi:hypothetical protein
MRHQPISCNNTNHVHTPEMLIDIVTGSWEPTPLEIQHLLEHLITCVPCRVILGACVILYAEKESAKERAQQVVDAFRTSLQEALHGIDFQNRLSAYIDILEAEGEEQADKQFPEVADHLQRCQVCRDVVEDTAFLLQESINSDRKAPPMW